MFSLQELIDVIIMTLALGFIFKDIFVRPSSPYDPLTYYKKKINLENFKFAIIATAPAVILHELAHKFVAIAYGLEATFHAHYFFLGIGLLMKLLVKRSATDLTHTISGTNLNTWQIENINLW